MAQHFFCETHFGDGFSSDKKKTVRQMEKSGKPTARPQKKARTKTREPHFRRETDTARLYTGANGGLVALSAGGWWASSSLQAYAREQDLTRVGRGVPSIVQIYHPQ